jgi:hypothetical protein
MVTGAGVVELVGTVMAFRYLGVAICGRDSLMT